MSTQSSSHQTCPVAIACKPFNSDCDNNCSIVCFFKTASKLVIIFQRGHLCAIWFCVYPCEYVRLSWTSFHPFFLDMDWPLECQWLGWVTLILLAAEAGRAGRVVRHTADKQMGQPGSWGFVRCQASCTARHKKGALSMFMSGSSWREGHKTGNNLLHWLGLHKDWVS